MLFINKLAALFMGVVLLSAATVMSAGVPNVMNYQGRLTDAAGDPVADGAYLVKFIIYDAATGGTDLWNSGFQAVTTVGGVFSYDLGSNVLLPDLFGTDPNRYLGITVGADPEISPRSRFTSTGYVFKSLKSDLASDANSLGGLLPAFYLDWGNLTSVPAGFADGVDDEGIDQATADARYVEVAGDIMTGVLRMEDGSGTQVALLFSTIGELDLQMQNGSNAAFIAANTSFGGWLKLDNAASSTTISLRGNDAGDASVVIPTGAINSDEMFDEAGLAKGITSGSLTLSTTMQDIATVTINTPGPGYIFVTGRCWVQMNRDAVGGNFQLSFQIDETAGGGNLQSQSVFPSSSITNSTMQQAVYVDRAYFKSAAGTYTFRLEGFEFSNGGGTNRAGNGSATAMFFPTSYGSVATVAEQPGDHPDAKQVSIIGQDGAIITGYEMDLSYYEEKARAAKLAQQRADLAAAEAELELIKAKAAANQE